MKPKLDANHELLDGETPIFSIEVLSLRAHLIEDHGVQLFGAERVSLLLSTHAYVHGVEGS